MGVGPRENCGSFPVEATQILNNMRGILGAIGKNNSGLLAETLLLNNNRALS